MPIGTIYKTCQFDTTVSSVLLGYCNELQEKHKAFRTLVDNVYDRLSLFTEIDDLDEKITDILSIYGYSKRNQLRERFDYGDLQVTQSAMEEWLLDNTGIAVVNGIYVPQTPESKAVDLRPYQTVHSVTGLTSLKAALSGASRYSFDYYITVNGAVVSNVPPERLISDTGVEFENFDSVLFVWYGAENPYAKDLLAGIGFPSRLIYKMTQGISVENVTVVTLDRLDLFTQLEAMGLDSADEEVLFSRDINRVVIDTAMRRRNDSQDTVTGVYQSFPYPQELADELKGLVQMIPSSGQRTTTMGAKIYVPAISVLSKVLDLEDSFSLETFLQAASGRIDTNNQLAQGYLSALEFQVSEIARSYGYMVNKIGGQSTSIAEILEDVLAVYGIGIEGGTTTGASQTADIDFGNAILSDTTKATLEAAEGDLSDLWSAAASMLSMRMMLLQRLSSSFSALIKEGEALVTVARNVLEDRYPNGGSFDENGVTEDAIHNYDSVLSLVDKLTGNGFIELENLLGVVMSSNDLVSSKISSGSSTPTTTTFVRNLALASSTASSES